jgi:hypothetical protein
MKTFLRPTIVKITILILMLFFTVFLPKTAEICSLEVTTSSGCERIAAKGIGLPIFYGDKFMGNVVYMGFYPIHFAVNLILYYLIACSVLFLYRKIMGSHRLDNK